MAEVKITALPAYADPASTDVLPIVDVVADLTKKVSIDSLLKNAPTGSASAPSFAFDLDGNTGMYRSGADALAFSTGGTGRLFIDSSGNVGIGTSSPLNSSGYKTLTIGDDSSVAGQLALNNGAGNRVFLWHDGSNNLHQYNAGAAQIFYTGATERMRIDSSGNLGIGNSLPSTKLHIHDGSGSSAQIVKIDAGGVGLLSIQSGTTSQSRIEFGDSSNDDAGYIY